MEFEVVVEMETVDIASFLLQIAGTESPMSQKRDMGHPSSCCAELVGRGDRSAFCFGNVVLLLPVANGGADRIFREY